MKKLDRAFDLFMGLIFAIFAFVMGPTEVLIGVFLQIGKFFVVTFKPRKKK